MLRRNVLISLAAGLAGGASRGAAEATPPRPTVTRSSGARAPPASTEPLRSLLLREAPAGPFTRFDLFAASPPPATGVEIYELALTVRGQLVSVPRFVAYAEWRLADVALSKTFEQNRAALFRVRAAHLAEFHSDWLLRDVRRAGRYMVVGLYGAEAAMNSARTHPQIRRFAEANPVAVLGARDVYGVKSGLVVANSF